jgi:hypothetical protein
MDSIILWLRDDESNGKLLPVWFRQKEIPSRSHFFTILNHFINTMADVLKKGERN